MNRTELATAMLVLVGAMSLFSLSEVGTSTVASVILRAEGASAALAYLDECDECDSGPTYYSADPTSPDTIDYESEAAFPEALWGEPAFWPVSDEPIEYYEPFAGDRYDPMDSYYSAPDVIIYDEPWYESAFPGFGTMASYILPPIVRPQPIVQPQPAPQPSCSIVARPASVYTGGSTLVSWSAHNSARSVLSGVGDVAGTGSRTYSDLTSSQTFSLTVSGLGGTASCVASVTVLQRSVTPTCLISAHPSAIRKGETANIAWTSERAAHVYLSGYGPVAQSGGLVVSPQQSTVYTLSVSSDSGDTATCAIPLTVE